MEFQLVKWDLRFIDDVAEAANNPKIARYLRDVFPNPYTREDAECYVRSCAENDEEHQLCRAIVIDGRAAGSIGVFLKQDVYRKSAEIGYWLAEDYWGKGIMSRAVEQICAEAFARFDIVRISAEVFAPNTGSQRVLQKAGFSYEGVLRQSVFKNGELLDAISYAHLREQ